MIPTNYPKLFETGHIGNLVVKNRAIRNSMGTSLSNTDCSVSDRQLKAYAEAAEGGCGLIFMDNAVATNMHHMGISAARDVDIPGLSLAAEALKEHGALAGLQLAHPGRDTSIVRGTDCVAASAVLPDIMIQMGASLPRPLSIDEIHEIVHAFGDAALRAKIAGFDIVEIHGAAGCLPTNFLSPHDNQRTDEYGGSLENRMRFLLELVDDIRVKCGPDFPVSVKLSMDDHEPGGIRIEETIQVCKALEEHGVSLLNLVEGTHVTVQYSTEYYPMGYTAANAAKIKKEVRIPVMVSGSIQTPELAEKILEEGQADFIGLARSQLADPAFIRKAKEGHPEDIIPCIRCMVGCGERGMMCGRVTKCAVNPTLFKYETPRYEPAARPRKVAVIGGGPAGMEAAVTAKKRGHDVTLFEKRELGGALIEAGAPDFKTDMVRLNDYYKTQMKKNNVRIAEEEATAQTIRDGGYEAAIVAVGGKIRRLSVPGMDRENVSYAMDTLLHKGKNVNTDTVLVCGGGIVGFETAFMLSSMGKEVIVTTRRPDFVTSLGATAGAYIEQLMMRRIPVITGVTLKEIKDGAAVFTGNAQGAFGMKPLGEASGDEWIIPAEYVTVASGFLPQTELADEINRTTDAEVFVAGDCIKARMVYDAVHEGYIAGRNV